MTFLKIISFLGDIIIAIGLIFILFGVVGIFRFKSFYSRILISSKVDTVGFITIMIGFIMKNGFSWDSAKILLILIILLIINPVVTNAIANSAYKSGYRIDENSKDGF